MKIRIEISSEEIPETGTPVQKYDGECPIETKDTAKNMENKLKATEEYNYGSPTDPDTICGNCAAFNVSSRILDCLDTDSDNVGYCETHRFTCEAEKTCDSWVAGGPLTDEDFAGRGDAL